MRTRTLLFSLMMLAVVSAYGQTPQTVTQKIGFADWGYIMENMPEAKAMQTELQTHGSQLENSLKAKQADLQAKYDAFTKLPATTPDAIKLDKQRELQTLDESLQKFSADAQTSMQKKQADLMTPILDKIQKNIEIVAKEQGYTFIINPDLGGEMTSILLYADDQFDISNAVLKKMGITPPPTAQK
jgi:outer membrane protein